MIDQTIDALKADSDIDAPCSLRIQLEVMRIDAGLVLVAMEVGKSVCMYVYGIICYFLLNFPRSLT